MFKAKAEAKALRPRPRPMPNFWPRGHFGLEDLTSLISLNRTPDVKPAAVWAYSAERSLRTTAHALLESDNFCCSSNQKKKQLL